MNCDLPTLLDAVQCSIEVMAEASGLTPTDILKDATSKTAPSKMAALTWKLVESAGDASVDELARLFGQGEEVITNGLTVLQDADTFILLLDKVEKLMSEQKNKGKKPDPTNDLLKGLKYWKQRADIAEKKLSVANLELSYIREIAKHGGSWSTIENYLDDTGHE